LDKGEFHQETPRRKFPARLCVGQKNLDLQQVSTLRVVQREVSVPES
jgi:hypothetical protein